MLCDSLSDRQIEESPTMSTSFFLWYPLYAAGIVSLCRCCSWVYIAVKASDLVLVVMLGCGG